MDAFPAPLVLPHDDLNYDPECPRQDFRRWLSMSGRNKLSVPTREKLYVARIPNVTNEMAFMKEWSIPQNHKDHKPLHLDMRLFIDYLETFYYGMDVKTFPEPLSWTPWERLMHRRPSRRANLPKYIGLAHAHECTRIRVRSPPDRAFVAQLNLNDITDTMIKMLPDDAYAMILLIDQDMYEADEDDFCCGRAFGGNRVAVIQTARYIPCLDKNEGIDRTHMWPWSHCKDFVEMLCAVEDVKGSPPTKQQIASSNRGPIRAAVDAATEYQPSLDAEQNLKALWFSRLARTVSHELGHCFGMGHCVYYACSMQGTSSMKEDLRQPPYLCPVCEAKIRHAIAVELRGGGTKETSEWAKKRHEALMSFCLTLEEKNMSCSMWTGLYGWLNERCD
ncbi:hypothetical protein T440DRAFT_397579 [Plenodomus tracheiphilus IPT5]|uniref:Archaemetzincin-2 n=1 Tax=Plenodomus tracheiphilus IPT5 TaxID=1408161 RepID=A0A6A7B3U7_9PLEO|nr:hypothetical protein T440DRAFT_397579 [Plenodomus tracheiphilus IPT5]